MHNIYQKKLVAYLALTSGLSISVVAIYYSVSGLVNIFSASVIPIIIMGITLELSKLVATVWLKQNWSIAPVAIRAYLLSAILVLMTITSMGIFGFLAKAHSEQSAPLKNIMYELSTIDEKIKTQKENIESSKKALSQLDSTVDQTLLRSNSEKGASKAVNIRRSQTKERSQIQSEILNAQNEILKLTQERAPLAKTLNSFEAEVGPIKFIASLIYGDQINDTLLEKAVQWVIILIVGIFDPLAVVLLLASQYSFQYFNEIKKNENIEIDLIDSEPLIIKDNAQILEPINNKVDFDVLEPTNSLKPIKRSKQKPQFRKAVRLKKTKISEVDQLKAAKRKFKKENPGKTLHEFEIKKDLGVIGKLPWEDEKN